MENFNTAFAKYSRNIDPSSTQSIGQTKTTQTKGQNKERLDWIKVLLFHELKLHSTQVLKQLKNLAVLTLLSLHIHRHIANDEAKAERI